MMLPLQVQKLPPRTTTTTTSTQDRNLLVNGVDTLPNEYPFHVQIGGCSGALIAPDIVITAGHVVPSRRRCYRYDRSCQCLSNRE